MKRHPALQDLSRDHHLVLIHCQRFRRALGRDAPREDLAKRLSDFLAFYEADMLPHFQEEDELVVPRAAAAGAPRLREVAHEIHADHAWLRTRIASLRAKDATDATTRQILTEIEARITRHVQLEEAELFEGVQEALREAELQALWRESHAFRRDHRSPAACGAAPPPGRRG